MEYFLQQLINGLTLGSIYGLIAIGYTMVYGIIGMINFAHGDVFMVGSVTSFIVVLMLGLTGGSGVFWIILALALVVVIAMFIAATYNWTIERLAYRPLRGSFRLAPLISAIGMSIVLQEFVRIAQEGRPKPIQPIITGNIPIMSKMVGDQQFVVTLSYMQIMIILSTLALMTVFTLIIQRTSLGRAQRACEQDTKMASLLGINVDRTIAITFILGAALAAFAGMMFFLYYNVTDFFIGFAAGIKAFTAAVLGGIGSIPGAMLGGMMIGLIEVMWSAYFSVEYKDVASFGILVLVLIFMPQGLLGKPETEKV
ncbi:ABC transporter permease subunit [Aestuariivirga litoralis]|uniref:ABC transporter permease subunit n=1 Tax=Aestuariivirga litoralis TaxID=2650924 RepID=UPI0018C59544|nr:branched-chain amino acid ABC transporter permease LivH [Aestuariivirga litoralis]MBG1231942.1 branched-chain amino acid ABC transporter permease LivH [Aestuariivirga litoralis]